MDHVRKRPTAHCQLTTTVPSGNVELTTGTTSRSQFKRRKTSRSKLFPAFFRLDLPIILITIVLIIVIYKACSIIFLVTHAGDKKDIESLDRVLFHDIPKHIIPGRGRVHHEHFLPQRPRMIGNYFTSSSSESYLGTERIDVDTFRLHKTYTVIEVSEDAAKAQEHLLDSKDYKFAAADPFETEDCVAQYEWQKHSFPTCNHILEQDMTNLKLNNNGEEPFRLIAHGYWRDVWKRKSDTELVVLKTMRWEHEYADRNYDRHRRDSVAMEQLTSSPWVMDIYGFCGNSGLFEFADGGSLYESLFDDDTEGSWSPANRLAVAFQVASGIAATHNHPKEGVPAMAHTDIAFSQFVYVSSSGIFKLNDFNRCRFLPWNKKTNTTCTFEVGNNAGTFRSPEEYLYEQESEKVDVYSMGNIFYSLLTGLYPFDDVSKSEKTEEMVMQGVRPKISQKILNSTNPFEQTLLNATLACWIQDPKQRISAREVQMYIRKELVKQGIFNS